MHIAVERGMNEEVKKHFCAHTIIYGKNTYLLYPVRGTEVRLLIQPALNSEICIFSEVRKLGSLDKTHTHTQTQNTFCSPEKTTSE